jgi:hypothetical protein
MLSAICPRDSSSEPAINVGVQPGGGSVPSARGDHVAVGRGVGEERKNSGISAGRIVVEVGDGGNSAQSRMGVKSDESADRTVGVSGGDAPTFAVAVGTKPTAVTLRVGRTVPSWGKDVAVARGGSVDQRQADNMLTAKSVPTSNV